MATADGGWRWLVTPPKGFSRLMKTLELCVRLFVCILPAFAIYVLKFQTFITFAFQH